MIKKESRNQMRLVRHRRVRANMSGTKDIPRFNVYRSNTGIYAQIIDDENQKTLVSASTLDKELNMAKKKDIEAAKSVGRLIAERARQVGITKVVFDRGGYLYHGRVKALADAAREKGLEF